MIDVPFVEMQRQRVGASRMGQVRLRAEIEGTELAVGDLDPRPRGIDVEPGGRGQCAGIGRLGPPIERDPGRQQAPQARMGKAEIARETWCRQEVGEFAGEIRATAEAGEFGSEFRGGRRALARQPQVQRADIAWQRHAEAFRRRRRVGERDARLDSERGIGRQAHRGRERSLGTGDPARRLDSRLARREPEGTLEVQRTQGPDPRLARERRQQIAAFGRAQLVAQVGFRLGGEAGDGAIQRQPRAGQLANSQIFDGQGAIRQCRIEGDVPDSLATDHQLPHLGDERRVDAGERRQPRQRIAVPSPPPPQPGGPR